MSPTLPTACTGKFYPHPPWPGMQSPASGEAGGLSHLSCLYSVFLEFLICTVLSQQSPVPSGVHEPRMLGECVRGT